MPASESSLLRADALTAPLPRGLGRLAPIARSAALAGVRGWKHGCLTLRLPDGTTHVIGDARDRERADVRVRDESFFVRVLLRGEMGAGESFVAGEWDSDDLVLAVRLFLRNLPGLGIETSLTRFARIPARIRHLLRDNRKAQSEKNIHAHYDLGNEFYRRMLDPTMAYSCALYREAGESLESAQRNKFEGICNKLDLRATDHVLEIGCGWGGFAMHAASTRGCRVTGVTVSREQFALATERVVAAGLSDRIDVQFRDYREIDGRYDKIVSIEMLEAVGHAHYGEFFATCGSLLARDGVMLVQTISMPDHRYEDYRRSIDWMQSYVFPGVSIPSLSALTRAMARHSDLSIHHLEDIGPHYAPTLRAWRDRYVENLDEIRALGFDDVFDRTWRLYLSFSEAAFAERDLGDLQIVFTRPLNRTLR